MTYFAFRFANNFFRITVRSLSSKSMAMVDIAKQAAAKAVVDAYVTSNSCIGIGSGSTIVYVVQHLASLLKSGTLSNICCVPTSLQSRQLLFENGVRVGDLEQCPILDVAIDGADEVDPSLNCIKGGGACHMQEKCVASCAKKFVLVGDESKRAKFLGERWTKGVPIEVLSLAHHPVKLKIESTLGGHAVLRMAERKAGPVVTDNGNLILDWQFSPEPNRSSQQWRDVNTQLKMIPGVLETGLFIDMAEKCYLGSSDGKVIILEKK